MKNIVALILVLSLNACAQDIDSPVTWVARGSTAAQQAEIQIGIDALNGALGCKAVTLVTGDCDPSTEDCMDFVDASKLDQGMLTKAQKQEGYEVAGECIYGTPDEILMDKELAPYEARKVALHELGHSFGLGHTNGTLMQWNGYAVGEDDVVQWAILIGDLATRIDNAGFKCPTATPGANVYPSN